MEHPLTIWRVTTRFRDYGGTLREAPTYFRCLDAARAHFEDLKGRPADYLQSVLEELLVLQPIGESLCATITEEIEDEYVLKVQTLEVWRSPVRTPPDRSMT